MGFGTLVVIVLTGLGGPLLGIVRHRFVPVVIGEILAGILVGPSVLNAVQPASVTITFLGEIGFAMLMLTVGMHLPLREKRLTAALRSGGLLAAIVCVLAVPAGLLAASIAGAGHTAIYVVLLASGSAAVLLPALEETGITGPDVMTVMAQVTIANLITILSVPIVLQPGRVIHVALGGVLVTAAVLGATRPGTGTRGSGLGSSSTYSSPRSATGRWTCACRSGPLPARLDRREGRHEHPDRRLRCWADGGCDRRAETSLHADARRSRGVLHPAVLRGARRST